MNWPHHRHRWRGPPLLALALLVVAGCGGAGGATTSGSWPTPDSTPRGGTLRVAIPQFAGFVPPPGSGIPPGLPGGLIDPQENTPTESFELWRCCLLRTLLSHRGAPTNRGGAELVPDLASAMPDVSADGLTWTFRLRSGLRYGPPLQSTEITTPDIVRALERTAHLAKVSQIPPFFSVISGFDAYADGKADTIAGLETPDPHTLVVRLTGAAGDLGERMSLPPAAPIPPLPSDPRARFGVATGHDDGDSAFLVSSGPYMVEGIDKVDFSLPPAQQRPASGYVPGKAVTLVRNPSWRQAIDALRPAYVDRIEVTGVGTLEEASAGIDKGTTDLVLIFNRPPQAPPDQIAAYRASGGPGRLDVHARDAIRSMTMNLAVAPFDDLHVRRAVNYVIDKAKVLDEFGGQTLGALAGHVAPDSLEQDALVNYDPYRSKGNHGDLAAAKGEMAMSRYDPEHDGVCHADACKHVVALSFGGTSGAMIAATIRENLAQIGIGLDVTALSPEAFFGRYLDPTQHVAAGLIVAWSKDFLNASDYFNGELSGAVAGMAANILLGATPDQLRSWGYSVSAVPSIDDRISECLRLVGTEQLRCWTALDEYVTEKVAPIVPLIAETQVTVIPKRIVAFSYDQAWTLPALDRVALAH